ncbi:hypothetical protein INR49_015651 [Caranx melampygus]|nr:hypothetical protein INR49_015651 [Caranx melampygus]
MEDTKLSSGGSDTQDSRKLQPSLPGVFAFGLTQFFFLYMVQQRLMLVRFLGLGTEIHILDDFADLFAPFGSSLRKSVPLSLRALARPSLESDSGLRSSILRLRRIFSGDIGLLFVSQKRHFLATLVDAFPPSSSLCGSSELCVRAARSSRAAGTSSESESSPGLLRPCSSEFFAGTVLGDSSGFKPIAIQ